MSAIAVRVRYYNVLAIYAGTKQTEVRVAPGTSTEQLLRQLAADSPELLRGALLRGEALSTYLRVFRNESLLVQQDFAAPLADGDDLMLFPAVAGG